MDTTTVVDAGLAPHGVSPEKPLPGKPGSYEVMPHLV